MRPYASGTLVLIVLLSVFAKGQRKGIELYGRLLKLSQDCSISLAEFARRKFATRKRTSRRSKRCFAAEETLRKVSSSG